MDRWPTQPIIYEINTAVWVNELGRRYHRPVTLATVPPNEWDALSRLGVDAIWLMGVWERSPEGTRIALEKPELLMEYRAALPDCHPDDIIGSPYCIHRYVVDERLGGPEGLAHARSMLAHRNLRLVLDYVPNHVARDHPWVHEHPEYFIRGSASDIQSQPENFFESCGSVFACGRDPFFPAWTDTAQLNAFHPDLRIAAISVVEDIAHQCDGVRCDMAMLLMTRVFAGTWGERAGGRPALEYWRELIEAARKRQADFLFVGEAYWDMEWELQQQGFDYCYDKRLYDRLVGGNAEDIRLHLQADISYQERLVRFIENHDEPRAAQAFPPRKLRAAAVTVASLPGAKLLHDGQIEGRKVRLPVQLGRRQEEAADEDLSAFFLKLCNVTGATRVRNASWQLCACTGWPDNRSCQNLIAWSWDGQEGRLLVVLNISDQAAQARVRANWSDLGGRMVKLQDLLSGDLYTREGSEILDYGLYVDLPGWGFHFLSVTIG